MFRMSKILLIIFVFLLSCTPIFCFAQAVPDVKSFVAENNQVSPVEPAYVAITSVTPHLTFYGNIAQPSVSVKCSPGKIDKIIFRVTLEKKSGGSYVPVKTWRDQSVSVDTYGRATYAASHVVTEKGTYRVKVSGTAYKGANVVETFSEIVSADVVY